MRYYFDLLIGDQEYFSFEYRAFNIIMLLAMIVTLFGAIIDILLYDLFINIFFLLVWLVLFLMSRLKGKYNSAVIVSVLFLVYVFIPINWIISGGLDDCIPYYTMVCTVTLCMLLKGKVRLFLSGSMVVVVAVLIYYDVVCGVIVDYNIFVLGISEKGLHFLVALISIIFIMTEYTNLYVREKARNKEYSLVIEEQNKQQIYYMKNLEEIIYKLRAERHDYNNHLGVVYSLLEMEDVDSARLYTTQLVEKVEEYQNVVMIEYPMIKAMLNYKLSVFKENDIELKLNIKVPPNLELNSYDFTVILGNLFDNAFEANMKLGNEERYFDMKLEYNPNYFVIKIGNPVNRKLNNRNFKTTKSYEDNHGFGLKNIEYLVNKHNGYMKVLQDEKRFEVHIALLIE
jgi:hypothetical protein